MTDNQRDPRHEESGSRSQQSQQPQQGNRKETDPNNPTSGQRSGQPGSQQGGSQQRQDPSDKRGKTGTGVEEGIEREEDVDEEEEEGDTRNPRSKENQGVGNQNARKDQ